MDQANVPNFSLDSTTILFLEENGNNSVSVTNIQTPDVSFGDGNYTTEDDEGIDAHLEDYTIPGLDQDLDILKEGKKFLVLNDYENAVKKLASACRGFLKKFGIYATECGDVYYQYGHALMELGWVKKIQAKKHQDRLAKEEEDSVITQEYAIVKKEEDTFDKHNKDTFVKDKDEFSKQDEETFAQHSKQKNDTAEDDTLATEENVKLDQKDNKISQKEKGIVRDEDLSAKQDNCSFEDPSAEDYSTLLLRAKEVLEVGKEIYIRRTSSKSDNVQRLADIYLALGKLAREDENVIQAIIYLNASLEKRVSQLPGSGDDRKVAETHYELGVVLTSHNQPNEAVKNFNNSLQILNAHLGCIKADGLGGDMSVDEIVKIETFIKQIQQNIFATNACMFKNELKFDEHDVTKMQSSPQKISEVQDWSINKEEYGGRWVAKRFKNLQYREFISGVLCASTPTKQPPK